MNENTHTYNILKMKRKSQKLKHLKETPAISLLFKIANYH